MQTIMIDSARYADGHALHAALRSMLNLPDYYGMNADALHDCLAERTEPIHVWVVGEAEGDTARALKMCLQVVEDLGGTVKKIG